MDSEIRTARQFIKELLPRAFDRVLEDYPNKRWLAKWARKVAECIVQLALLTASKLKQRMKEAPGTVMADQYNDELAHLMNALMVSWDEKGDVYRKSCCLDAFGQHPIEYKDNHWARLPSNASSDEAEEDTVDDLDGMSPDSWGGPLDRWFLGMLNMFGEKNGLTCILKVCQQLR